MRFFVITTFFSACAWSLGSSPVQQTSALVGNGAATAFNITVSSTGSGNLLGLCWGSVAATQVTSITGGGTWASVQSSHTNRDSEIWAAPNSSSGTTTVTVNTTGTVCASSSCKYTFFEWTGVATSTPKDQGTSATSAGTTTPTTGTITTTQASELVIASSRIGGATTLQSGPTNSFTEFSDGAGGGDTGNKQGACAYFVQSSSGNQSTAWTYAASNPWEAQIASFKAAAAGTTEPLFRQSLLNGLGTAGQFFANPIAFQPFEIGLMEIRKRWRQLRRWLRRWRQPQPALADWKHPDGSPVWEPAVTEEQVATYKLTHG